MKVICNKHKVCGNTSCSHATEHIKNSKCEMQCDTIKKYTICGSTRKDKLIKLKKYIDNESYL